jgi:hypothetical protein
MKVLESILRRGGISLDEEPTNTSIKGCPTAALNWLQYYFFYEDLHKNIVNPLWVVKCTYFHSGLHEHMYYKK